jgi:hypothetical protein
MQDLQVGVSSCTLLLFTLCIGLEFFWWKSELCSDDPYLHSLEKIKFDVLQNLPLEASGSFLKGLILWEWMYVPFVCVVRF